jgi:hypothetical protein
LAVSLQPTGPVLLALSYSELWAPAVKASGFTPEQHAPPRILTCGSSISTGLFYGGAEIWLVATTQIIFGPDNADLMDQFHRAAVCWSTHTDRSLSPERWGIIIADGEGILLQRFDDSDDAKAVAAATPSMPRSDHCRRSC